MKIAWTSNAPWCPTGYGVQTKEVVPRLVADGHDVAVMANFGLSGSTIEFDGVKIMGAGFDSYSNDLTPYQMKSWITENNKIAGIGITLYDVWVYKSPDWDEFPIASWVPIDHVVVPDGVKQWFKRGGDQRWAIAMSQFGKNELLEANILPSNIFYAPHSFNGNIFKPIESEIRKQIGVPKDAHLTMINAQNKGLTPIRKCWPEMIEAWVKFAENKDDAYLYIHAEFFGIANGVKLGRLLSFYGAPPERVKIVPQFEYRQGISQNVLAQIYSSADVLLMTSRGEGFGVPVIEAQACGTPVIVTNWTAQPELVGSGWKVDGKREWDEFQTGWWKVPDVNEITEALEQSYKAKGSKRQSKKMSQDAIEFTKKYETRYVYNEHWKPILQELEKRIVPE